LLCETKAYTMGHNIYKEGDEANGFFIVKSGEFKVRKVRK